ncbi:MAG: hypothetical protein BV459_01970 [Thermoplasmata archaeon M11B2D]|nr:MAG: hypothetical protein BV459_01970 [Thermoplasmata archaeon M11B2D]
MGAPWHNRQNWTDVIESGKYIVPKDKSLFIGEPAKITGSTSGEGVPAYDIFYSVSGYDDATGVEACAGVSEDEVIRADNLPDGLRNIEFRHGRRDIDLCLHGDRTMLNKQSGYTAKINELVAPAPGGFQKWSTGKTVLGKVKEGPIEYNQRGLIMIDTQNVAP